MNVNFTFVEEDSAEKTFVLILASIFIESENFTRCCYYWVNPRLKQYFSKARFSVHHADGNQKTYTDERVLEEGNIPFRCLPVCIGFILVLKCSEMVYFWSYSIFKLGFLVIYHPLVCIQTFLTKNSQLYNLSRWKNVNFDLSIRYLMAQGSKKWYQYGFVSVIKVSILHK